MRRSWSRGTRIALGWGFAAIITRLLRNNLIEVYGRPFMLVARAKGCSGWVLLWRHAMRNAIASTVTIVGLQVGYLLAGAVAIEVIFGRPGLGSFLVARIQEKDVLLSRAWSCWLRSPTSWSTCSSTSLTRCSTRGSAKAGRDDGRHRPRAHRGSAAAEPPQPAGCALLPRGAPRPAGVRRRDPRAAAGAGRAAGTGAAAAEPGQPRRACSAGAQPAPSVRHRPARPGRAEPDHLGREAYAADGRAQHCAGGRDRHAAGHPGRLHLRLEQRHHDADHGRAARVSRARWPWWS